MNILVTGGAGFIGSHVADAYVKAGHKVVIIDNLSMGNRKNINSKAEFYRMDIRNKKVKDVVKKERIDVINHHAAQISVPDSVKNPFPDADINIKGTLNILEAAKNSNVKKFIFISSGGTVYGTPSKFPASEKLPVAPENPYGISKTAAEFYVKFYAAQTGMQYTILRYSNVYGPRQIPHGEAGVVSIFITMIMKNIRPVIFGGGKCVRDYVYAGDVARANILALKKGKNREYNIGTGKKTSVNMLYSAVKKVTGFKKPARSRPFRAGDIPVNYLSSEKAKKELGWKPKVSLAEGIEETYRYFDSVGKGLL